LTTLRMRVIGCKCRTTLIDYVLPRAERKATGAIKLIWPVSEWKELFWHSWP